MKNILVTGGAGYIGCHAVKKLAEAGYDPIIVDDLSQGQKRLVKGRELLMGDVGDYGFLTKVFKKYRFDSVMHFAAYALVGESTKDPVKYFRNNFGSSLNLLKVMLENDVHMLIYSSTCSTYGEPVNIPITEEHPQNPINPYGESKLAFERALSYTAKASELKYASLRYFNVAGADESGTIGEMHNPETHIVPLALEAILKGGEFSIFGDDYETKDGTCVRDYIHVNDLVDAHILAMDRLERSKDSKIYNLGNGEGFSVKEVLNATEKVTGKKLKTKTVGRREGDPAVLIASSEKIKRELGWKPKYTSIEKIIETAYRWHKNLA